MKHKLLFWAIVTGFLFLTACSESDFPELDSSPPTTEGVPPVTEEPGETEEPPIGPPVDPKITIDTKSYILPIEQDSIEVPFESSASWEARITDGASLECSLTPSSGDAGSAKLIVSFTANDSYDPRTAQIIIKSDTIVETVILTQPERRMFIVEDTTDRVFYGDNSTLDIKVRTNMEVEVNIDPNAPWITMIETRGLSEEVYRFDIAERSDDELFVEGYVTLTAGDRSYRINIAQGSTYYRYVQMAKGDQLGTILTAQQLQGTKRLVVTGEIASLDFATIRDNMPALEYLNLEHTAIGSIPDYAFCDKANGFKGKTSLLEIILPERLTDIGDFAFRGCSGLKSVIFPETLATIGQMAFSLCSGLDAVKFPSSLSRIGNGAFRYCGKLRSADLARSSPAVIPQYLFANCASLEEVSLPASVRTVGEGAFLECEKLGNVAFAEGLATIEDEAFYGCIRIRSLELPSTLLLIKYAAFSLCSSLDSVTIHATTPPEIDSSVFSYIPAAARLFVPAGYKTDYQVTVWNTAFKGGMYSIP